jgi:hypothetical protein
MFFRQLPSQRQGATPALEPMSLAQTHKTPRDGALARAVESLKAAKGRARPVRAGQNSRFQELRAARTLPL